MRQNSGVDLMHGWLEKILGITGDEIQAAFLRSIHAAH